jgi:hypothetical protein
VSPQSSPGASVESGPPAPRMQRAAATVPTNHAGPSAWLHEATPEQREVLTIEQELSAHNLRARIDGSIDSRALRELASELGGPGSEHSPENLPDWVIDQLIASIEKRLSMDQALSQGMAAPPDGVNPHVSPADVDCADNVGPSKRANGTDEVEHRVPDDAATDDWPLRQASTSIEKTNSTTQVAKELFKVNLPELWGHGLWGVPVVCVQSALFPPRGSKSRPFYGPTRDAKVILKSLSHSKITASGERLTIGHLDLLLCLIDLAKNGNPIETTVTAILEHMQRNDGTRDVLQVRRMLKQLNETWISISFRPKNTHRRQKWSGTLLQTLEPTQSIIGKSTTVRIALDPGLSRLFGQRWTFVRISDRAALRKSPMASALHLAYSQHVDASIPYSLKTVRELLGVRTDGDEFKCLLEDALLTLESKGLIAGSLIENDSLRVAPTCTPSKRALLARLAREPVTLIPRTVSASATAKSPTSPHDALKTPNSGGVPGRIPSSTCHQDSYWHRIGQVVRKLIWYLMRRNST